MCGISGTFSSRPDKSELVRASIREISHRGPDEEGFYSGKTCSLGMCRLAIIDVAHGQQPNFNSQRNIVSVFNGEIYNYRELQKLLIKRGVKIQSSGDSALIPYLYEMFGDKFTELLQGMFAIAIYDIAKERILLVRDRFGEKPLWYSHNEEQIHFSSELKGLFKLGVKKEIATSNIVEYLNFGYINAPRSAYHNVSQVPPASLLTFHRGKLSISEYWKASEIEESSISFPEAVEEVEKLLRESVRARLVSERPIGAFLSGGIDSTLVSTFMQQESDSKVHTFSIGFLDPKFDETNFARDVAQVIGTIHHEKVIHPQPELILNTLGKMLDQPFADSSIIPTFLLSQFAREHLVVALSGDGGDEAFAGYERYRAGRSLDSINPVLGLNPLNLIPANRIENQRFRKLLKHSNRTSLLERYRGFQSLIEERQSKSLVNNDFHKQIESDYFESTWNSIPAVDRVRKMQEMDLRTYLPGDLMYKVDIASMANSLEVRTPFLDHRVVELGIALPAKYKIRKGESKFILREIARKYIPTKLVDRPKMGFGIPRGRWLREDLRTMVWDILLDETSNRRGWYQQDEIRKVLIKHQDGLQLDSVIWPIFMLELWARNWID